LFSGTPIIFSIVKGLFSSEKTNEVIVKKELRNKNETNRETKRFTLIKSLLT